MNSVHKKGTCEERLFSTSRCLELSFEKVSFFAIYENHDLIECKLMFENESSSPFLFISTVASDVTTTFQGLGLADAFSSPLAMPAVLELLSILVFGSIIFVWGVRYNNIKDEFKHFNLPKWLRDLVGILKFSFAIMLLNEDYEIVRIGALGIGILMIAALFTHLRLKSKLGKMLPSFTLLCVCLIISYLCTQLLFKP